MCDAAGKAVHVGSIVDAHWGGGSWYAARVTGIKVIDGRLTASVQFADGDSEKGLGPARLRIFPRLTERGRQPRFAVGARVEARWQGGEPWYPGRITAVRVRPHAILGVRDTYSVAFDDGDFEEAAAFFCVRRQRVPGDSDDEEDDEDDSEDDDLAGEEEEEGGSGSPPRKAGPGAVGARAADAAAGGLGAAGAAAGGGAAAAPVVGRDRAGAEVRVGDRVEALWAGGEDWWQAVVTGVWQRGDQFAFDVRYMDGAVEKAVAARLVRLARPLPPAEGGLRPGEVLAVGAPIQARWFGGGWWAARISGVRMPPAAGAAAGLGAPAGEEVYQITYDDGTVEEGVQRGDLRRPGFGPAVGEEGYDEDDEGEGYEGEGDEGEDEDDGDEADAADQAAAAQRIAAAREGRVAPWGRDVYGQRVRTGEWVEGDWMAGGQWWAARVTAIVAIPGALPHRGVKGGGKGARKKGFRVRAAGARKRAPDSYLFWLRYVDGSAEGPLAAAMVRQAEPVAVPGEEVEAGPLQVGDAVFARWLGGPKWWAAKVVQIHPPEPAAAKAAPADRPGNAAVAAAVDNGRQPPVKAVAGLVAAAPSGAAAYDGGAAAGAGAEAVAIAHEPAAAAAAPLVAAAGAGAAPGKVGKAGAAAAGAGTADEEDEDGSDEEEEEEGEDSDDGGSEGSAYSISDLPDVEVTFTLRYDADGAVERGVRRCHIRRQLPEGAVDPGAGVPAAARVAAGGGGVANVAAAEVGLDGGNIQLPIVNGRMQYGAVPGHGPTRSDDEEDEAEVEAPVFGHAGGHRVIPGALVEARYDGASLWAARVLAVHPAAAVAAAAAEGADAFDLVFLDGVVRLGVPAAAVSPIRRLPYPASAGPASGQPGYRPLRVGTRIQARWLGGGDWWPGVVTGVHKGPAEGEADDEEEDDRLWTYSVDYDDGSSEVFLPRRYLKRDG